MNDLRQGEQLGTRRQVSPLESVDIDTEPDPVVFQVELDATSHAGKVAALPNRESARSSQPSQKF